MVSSAFKITSTVIRGSYLRFWDELEIRPAEVEAEVEAKEVKGTRRCVDQD